MKRTHVVIEGKVQGVYFRASLQQMARSLGFTGWVGNLPDGNVEALFEGAEENLPAMLDWCRLGPPRAFVQNVETTEEPYSGDFPDFTVRY
jgi:acylphosphatase